jgi:hypothetical protein
MVIAAIGESAKDTKPWQVIIVRIVIFAVAVVAAAGGFTHDWVIGLWIGGIVLAIPIGGVLLNFFWGAICIPPMVLTMKLFGHRSPPSRTADDGHDSKTPSGKGE